MAYCRACGCVLKAKTACKACSCPYGLWGPLN